MKYPPMTRHKASELLSAAANLYKRGIITKPVYERMVAAITESEV